MEQTALLWKHVFPSFWPIFCSFWRCLEKAAKAVEDFEAGRGEPNKPEFQERTLYSHILKRKSTWSQLTDFLGETSQLTLNSTSKDGQVCAFPFFRRWNSAFVLLFFFFFCYKTRELLDSFIAPFFNSKACLDFNFHSKVWSSFASVISNKPCFTHGLQCCFFMQRVGYGNSVMDSACTFLGCM